MQIESKALSISSIGSFYNVDGKQLERQYKEFISGFSKWDQFLHADEYVVFKENMGNNLSIDETSLSNGELYTILTNKNGKGKKGSLVAMIKGTKSDFIIRHLNLLPRSKRLKVKEITLDLSPTMMLIAKKSFPNATIVSDRFHVQKLMGEAISDLRISHRWAAIDEENSELKLASECGYKYISCVFQNGDTKRQLLARSRHIILKNRSKWTDSQRKRAELLFEEYPDIEQAYEISMELTDIYNKTTDKAIALTKLAHWYNKVEALGLKYFNSVINTMQNNYATISNYFENRSTNASAESFNAKVKAFRSQFRGVRDIPFFIFRLSKIFA